MPGSVRFASLLIGALLCPVVAYAGEPSPCSSASECSKQAFAAGVAAYERADYVTALSRFRDALRLREHPVIAFNLALAESKNSLFLQAVNRLDAVSSDPRTPADLKARVASEREVAARSLATITFDSASSQGLLIRVDDQEVGGSPPSVQLNPGKHQLSLVLPKGVKIQRPIELTAGETLRVLLDNASELNLVVTNPEKVAQPVAAEPSRKPLSPTWFFVALGSTVAVGAVATWSGFDTLSAYHSYDRDLPNLKQAEANQRVADGHSKENRTNMLLGATGFLGLGTAAMGLWLVDWKTPVVAVSPTASGVVVSGRF
jgi:hypothetical protein